MRLVRLLVAGLIALGVVLALTASPSASGSFAQTGYGSDTVPPRVLEVEPGEQAGALAGDDDDGGSNTWVFVGVGAGFVMAAGAGAYLLLNRRRFE